MIPKVTHLDQLGNILYLQTSPIPQKETSKLLYSYIFKLNTD
jgi:hypothetical protein